MRRYIPFLKTGPLVSVVRLQGIIAAQGRGVTLNDAALAPLLDSAFTKGKPAAVALILNSPGGSPTQSSLIAARIRRLAEEKGVKVYAFVEDVAASGGYYIAVAADEIWLDVHSIVGSIGVISAGFGLSDFIARHGIERRVYTAGKSKSMLDPFRPENPEDVARLRAIQDQVHEDFIAHVKARRGDRLSGDDLFNGDIWIGRKAVELGLADGVGHMTGKMKDIFGKDVRFRSYRQRRPFLSRFGSAVIGDAIAEIDNRAAYARYGL